MELSFMPIALAASGNNKNPPSNYTTYKQFIQAVVQHCVDKYGAADVAQWYWEVWNEPDYAGFWTATIADYYTLYDNAVDGITAVIPSANVGGPATTEPSKIAAFLQHCKTANKRVTFASSHVYPGGAAAGAAANAAGLLNDNNTRRSQITSGGYTTTAVKSLNTEWNSSYNGQGGLTGDVVTSMDNHWNVGFILKGVKLLSDKNSGDTPPIDVFSYWVLSDVFDESSGPSGLVHPGPGRKPAVRPGVRSHDLSGHPQGGVQRLQDARLPRSQAPDVQRRHGQRRRRRDGDHVGGRRRGPDPRLQLPPDPQHAPAPTR